jgi:predicted RNase H-like HicB family nuclease
MNVDDSNVKHCRSEKIGRKRLTVPVMPIKTLPKTCWVTNGRDIMKFPVTIDRDEVGVWVVECPTIPGCVSQGQTRDEALKNIEEAIALCLEVRAERGLPLTVETRQVEVTI